MGNNNWEDDDGWENEDDIYSGTEMIRPDDKKDEDIFDMAERLLKEKRILLSTIRRIAEDTGSTGEYAIEYREWCKEALNEIEL